MPEESLFRGHALPRMHIEERSLVGAQETRPLPDCRRASLGMTPCVSTAVGSDAPRIRGVSKVW
jgi:hypothetical protein